MDIQHKKSGNKGSFYIARDETMLAEMTYTMPSEDKIIIQHTEVSDELRGQNIGNQLVHTGVEYARSNNLKIVPLCSFAHAVFKKKTEYSDVLYVQ